jgi:hypothetical protein
MLTRFSVEGFKNFEKKITLDFTDVRDYKFHPECVTNGVINTAIIYGKNAVGKSNFGLALFDIVSHLTTNYVTQVHFDYYLNANNTNGCAAFEYEFTFGNDKIVYGYSKTEKGKLLSEYLSLNRDKLFRIKSADDRSIDGLIELAPYLNWELNTEISALKYFYYNSQLDSDHPISKMMNFVNHMLWYRCVDDYRFTGFQADDTEFQTFILKNKEYLDEFNDLLKKAGVDESVAAKKDADGTYRLYFDTKRPMLFDKASSSGTWALFRFFFWKKFVPNVSLFFIDEFDAFYHYELAETIVSILEEMSGVQKILTSHNTNLLSNRIMRPDCYFIMTRDKLTSFANATKRELREGHNLEKLYMNGEFDE